MNAVQQLAKLQEGYEKVKRGTEFLNNNKDIQILNNLKAKFQDTKAKFLIKKKEVEDIQSEYTKTNEEVEEAKEKLIDLEKKLYEDCGSDLKLISVCEKEIKDIKKIIDDKENEYLKLIESEDDVNKQKNLLNKELHRIKREFDEFKLQASSKIFKAKEDVKEGKEIVEHIQKEIPEDVLKIYEKLKKQVSNPVAKVENDVCLGCKIKLPGMIITELKSNKELVYCENCGRIIYLP